MKVLGTFALAALVVAIAGPSAAAIVYAAWAILEGLTATRRDTSEARDPTFFAYVGLRVATALALPLLATSAGSPVGGAVLVGIGGALRLAAAHTLGACYSHRVREPAAIVTRGPYLLVRHPAYLGMLVAHAGWLTTYPSVAGSLILMCGLLPAILWRISREEKMLATLPAWVDYSRSRARIVPGVF